MSPAIECECDHHLAETVRIKLKMRWSTKWKYVIIICFSSNLRAKVRPGVGNNSLGLAVVNFHVCKHSGASTVTVFSRKYL